VETWHGGRLVGGLYGVALGKSFFGESMFSVARDASKVALCSLVATLRARAYRFIDCQVASDHLVSLGARSVTLVQFLRELAAAIAVPPVPDASWRNASIALTMPFVQNPRGPRGR
jgi:leucyl/phenylalanyl-tRNA--protein transferase